MEKIDDNNLQSVSGGLTQVYNPAGKNDIAYTCPKCGFKTEIDTKNKFTDGSYKNDWTCPSCKTLNVTIFTYKKHKILSNSVKGNTFTKSELTNIDL